MDNPVIFVFEPICEMVICSPWDIYTPLDGHLKCTKTW